MMTNDLTVKQQALGLPVPKVLQYLGPKKHIRSENKGGLGNQRGVNRALVTRCYGNLVESFSKLVCLVGA